MVDGAFSPTFHAGGLLILSLPGPSSGRLRDAGPPPGARQAKPMTG